MTDHMFTVNGKRFRCQCGGNVFHAEGQQGLWGCNSCAAIYHDETYVKDSGEMIS